VPLTRAQERFGIHSFTFQRRRPFSAVRLERLLKAWPIPKKHLLALDELFSPPTPPPHEGGTMPTTEEQALRPVLRSKGFCWLDSEPLRQHVWAHAGKTLSVRPADWWWAALDPEQLKFKVTYPGVEAEYRVAKREKWDKEVGDRRQELVFIGGPQMREQDILALLEACLLTDAEFDAFRERTQKLEVPNDEFHLGGLLKNLGATEDQLSEMNVKAESRQREESLSNKVDRQDTDFLRSLGVGSTIEPDSERSDEDFEAVD